MHSSPVYATNSLFQMMFNKETLGTFVPWHATFFLQNLHDFEGWILKQEGSLADYVELKNPHTQVPWRSKGYLPFSLAQNTKPSILLTFQHLTLTFDQSVDTRGFLFEVGRMRFLKQCLQALFPASPPGPLVFFFCLLHSHGSSFFTRSTDREPGTG